MLSEPRTQMRGRSELLAAISCDIAAVRLGGAWEQREVACFGLAYWSLGSCRRGDCGL